MSNLKDIRNHYKINRAMLKLIDNFIAQKLNSKYDYSTSMFNLVVKKNKKLIFIISYNDGTDGGRPMHTNNNKDSYNLFNSKYICILTDLTIQQIINKL